MKLSKPSVSIQGGYNYLEMLRNIELAGRTCYKSEDKITLDSAEKFVKMLISRGHESVLEHEKLSIRFICDRGISHELVRHRIASFSQESTRYCDYNNGEVEFIIPPWTNFQPGDYPLNEQGDFINDLEPESTDLASNWWLTGMMEAETTYKKLRSLGWSPQQARAVLPNSLKTEIVVTANIREWRLIFTQRTANAAHPQMHELMRPLLELLKSDLGVLFEDITY